MQKNNLTTEQFFKNLQNLVELTKDLSYKINPFTTYLDSLDLNFIKQFENNKSYHLFEKYFNNRAVEVQRFYNWFIILKEKQTKTYNKIAMRKNLQIDNDDIKAIDIIKQDQLVKKISDDSRLKTLTYSFIFGIIINIISHYITLLLPNF